MGHNLKCYKLLPFRGHHEAFPLLSSLSLGGVASMSDSDVSLLLTPSDELRRRQSKSCSSSAPTYLEVGARLQALNLRECPLLTDKSLIVIRARCRSLRHLDLSHLPLLTTPALMSLFMQVLCALCFVFLSPRGFSVWNCSCLTYNKG